MRRFVIRIVLLVALVIPFGAAPAAHARCLVDCLITHGCITTVDGSICY